jgi:hypothetical protein
MSENTTSRRSIAFLPSMSVTALGAGLSPGVA